MPMPMLECVIEGHVPEDAAAKAAPRKPRRTPLPDHLPRDEVMHAAPDADGCSACGGTMGKLGEDVTEVLEYVSGRFRVVRHVRPKLSCNSCDAISQAPAPALPVPRGRAGPGLLAHVIVSELPFTCRYTASRRSTPARASRSAVRRWRTAWGRQAGCFNRSLIGSLITSWPA